MSSCDSATYMLGMTFYSLGRHALLDALCRLGLKAGDTVVFPAYYCESTLGILRNHGFHLAYVDVDEGLRVNEKVLRSLCDSGEVRAVVLVHYFGFDTTVSAALVDTCKRHGIHMLEDYCHSFLSFRPEEDEELFRNTSAYIFSMRKTLPVPDGGALLMGVNEETAPQGCPGAGSFEILRWLPFLIKGCMERLCIRIGWPNPYSRIIDRLRGSSGDVSAGMNGEADADPFGHVCPSVFLRSQLCHADDLRKITERRRKNYKQLLYGLRGIHGLTFPDLGNGESVPQILPVIAENAENLMRYLRNNGVGACPWPGTDMPREVKEHASHFPVAIKLNRKIVCMPIHQDISDDHIAYMEAIVRDFFQQKHSEEQHS